MARLIILVSTLLISVLSLSLANASPAGKMKSERLCSQCSGCGSTRCPASESFPHMTAHDDSLVAGALQSDFVTIGDRGVYAVPNIKGGEYGEYNSYFGWQSTSGSASGYHRFSNYMDKCSNGQSYLTADEAGRVGLRGLHNLKDLGQADWKTLNPPEKLDHQSFRFWVNRSTGKCLTVLDRKGYKRAVGVAECELDGSNPLQLFAFRFHYREAFCCCGVHNG